MDDLAAPTWYETAILCVLTRAERYLGHAVKTAQGWAAYEDIDEIGVFPDITSAKDAIEYSSDLDRPGAGSEITGGVLIGRQTSRDGVQHNVYKMPVSAIENQTRYRD